MQSILKKPRSVSESESGALLLCHSMSNASTSSFDGNSGSDDLSGSKKCVSFNKQVIRNVFKPGSTIAGMKKPNANKNSKKKNKRKRTISDPSHDASGASFRTRSVSESSDDSSSAFSNSCESLPVEETTATPTPADIELEPVPVASEGPSQKKKKKNKKKQPQSEPKTQQQQQFDMETMLQWKNQGRLPEDEVPAKPSCAIKFKNKIMNDLEE